jgi:drug/metabolite transporter (DMT)-like permease
MIGRCLPGSWHADHSFDKCYISESQIAHNSARHIFSHFSLSSGSFSFSCMFLFAKIMEGTADSFTLVFYRSLVQIVICYSAIVRNGENPLGGEDVRGWLLVRGGIGAGAVIAFFYAIQHLPLPDAVTLQFTTPPFAAAFAVCFAGEKWLPLDMIGAVVCLLGVVLIAHPAWLFGYHDEDLTSEGEDSSSNTFAIGVALLGAALAGMAYMSVRMIGHKASANVMVLYYGVLSIPIVLVGSKLLLGKWSVWGEGFFSLWDYFLLLMTGFAGYGGQYFTNRGLQRETAATVRN